VTAGLMLVAQDGTLRVMASSSEAMRVLELFEIQAEEGPCLDAHRTGEQIQAADLGAQGAPWPRFRAEALEAGLRSAHAVPMRLRGVVIGALNLFRAEPGPLSDEDAAVAQAFADVATIAILQHRAASQAQLVNDQLSRALNSRIVIEQAKGMVAERLDLDMPAAFTLLRRHARSNNLRLAALAEDVIAGAIAASSLDQRAGPDAT
jgi:GAF domain-containing protein